jgi:polysaccharide deacetylase family sporulation protein PdaB
VFLGVLGGLLLLGGLGRSGAAVRKPVVASRLAASVVSSVKPRLVSSLPRIFFEPAAALDGVWQNARKEVYKSVPELLARHEIEIERGCRHRKLFCGDTDRKLVAITFDDGPHPAYTPRLLAILKQYNAKATFFVVGERARQYPELIRDEVAAGHNVGNHTYHHVDLTKIPSEYVAAEMKACGSVIRHITGKAPHLFRPPGGNYDRQVASVADVLGYTMVLWSNDPGDYASPGGKVIESRVLGNIRNGSIVLIHDGIEQTIEVLPRILKTLDERGYDFVTIDEMLQDRS